MAELKTILAYDSNIPFAWQLLATAYERTNKTAYIPYAMAELYRTRGDIKNAKKMAKKALQSLPKDSKEYLKAEDILAFSDEKTNSF